MHRHSVDCGVHGRCFLLLLKRWSHRYVTTPAHHKTRSLTRGLCV